MITVLSFLLPFYKVQGGRHENVWHPEWVSLSTSLNAIKIISTSRGYVLYFIM